MNQFAATVKVFFKPGMNAPQGALISAAIYNSGHDTIENFISAKIFSFTLNCRAIKGAKKEVIEIYEKSLANPEIEDYELEIKP